MRSYGKPLTKKHIARAERDRRLRRLILFGTSAVLVVAIGLVAIGWVRVNLIQPGQPVATVNGEEILTNDFRGRVRFSQINLLTQIQQLQQFIQFAGDNQELRQSYLDQQNQLMSRLTNQTALGNQILELMIEETLIRQEARRQGIQVTEEEIDQQIAASFGFFPEGTPTPIFTSAPSPTPLATVTGLPTSTQGPSPTPRPSPTPYTRQAFEEDYTNYLASLSDYEVNEAVIRSQAAAQLYRSKLLRGFQDEVNPTQEQVQARHILVEDQETAEQVLERLQAGEDWAELVEEYSVDEASKVNDGDLGWFARGVMTEAFEQAAFEAEVGEIVGPVETGFGWHIIEVLGHEDRELSGAQLRQEANAVFNEWLSTAREDADIEIIEDWESRVPSPPLSGL